MFTFSCKKGIQHGTRHSMSFTTTQHELAQQGSISPESHNILQRIQKQPCTHCERPFYCSTRKVQDRFVCTYPNEAARPIVINMTKPDEPSLHLCSYCTTLNISHLAARHYFGKDNRPISQNAAAYVARGLEDCILIKLMVIVLPDFEKDNQLKESFLINNFVWFFFHGKRFLVKLLVKFFFCQKKILVNYPSSTSCRKKVVVTVT